MVSSTVRGGLTIHPFDNGGVKRGRSADSPTQTKTFCATLMRFPRTIPVLSPPHPPFSSVKSTLFKANQASSTLINPPPFLSIVGVGAAGFSSQSPPPISALRHLHRDLEEAMRGIRRRHPRPVHEVRLAPDGVDTSHDTIRVQIRRPSDVGHIIVDFNKRL